jgi:chemotaxis protein MotB
MKKKHEEPVQIIIRKKRHGGEHHGGAWKVALADFMTAMFCLFLVLWLVNQSTDIKSAIAGYFQDPLGRADEFGSSILPGDGAQSQTVRTAMNSVDVMELRRDRLQSLAKKIEKKIRETPDLAALGNHIEVTLTDEGLRIELIEDKSGFLFEKGAATPSPAGQAVLALLGRELSALDLPIRVEGHTDAYSYPSANGYTNWELSADRANAARRIMTEHGLRPGQVVQVRAFADRVPKVPDDPYSPRNRRVTIMMLLNDEEPEAASADSTGTAPAPEELRGEAVGAGAGGNAGIRGGASAPGGAGARRSEAPPHR